MANGTIENLYAVKKLTVTKVSSKIQDYSLVVQRHHGNIIMIQGWFHNTSTTSENEVLFSIPINFKGQITFSATQNTSTNPQTWCLYVVNDKISTSGLLPPYYYNINAVYVFENN